MLSMAPKLKGDPSALPNATKGLLCWVHTSSPQLGLICAPPLTPVVPNRAGGPDAHWREWEHEAPSPEGLGLKPAQALRTTQGRHPRNLLPSLYSACPS